MPTQADYAKIAIACKDLGLDRKQLIADRYGLDSAKRLNQRQLADLYSHFKRQGWTPKSSGKKSGRTYPQGYQRKVQALWITLAKAGVIKDRNDAAMNKWVCDRMAKQQRSNLRFCNYEDCSVLIEALKSWAKRTGVNLV